MEHKMKDLEEPNSEIRFARTNWEGLSITLAVLGAATFFVSLVWYLPQTEYVDALETCSNIKQVGVTVQNEKGRSWEENAELTIDPNLATAMVACYDSVKQRFPVK